VVRAAGVEKTKPAYAGLYKYTVHAPGLAGKSTLSWAWARPLTRAHASVLRHPTAFQYIELQLQLRIAWGRSMGPLAACVYGADKALPDTYIHTINVPKVAKTFVNLQKFAKYCSTCPATIC